MTTFTMRLFLPLNLTPLSSSLSLKYHSTTISFSSFSPGRSPAVPRSSSLLKSVCGCMQGDQNVEGWRKEEEIGASMFGSDDEVSTQVPTQVQSLVEGSGSVVVSEFKPVTDVDYLQELLAIQQQGPRNIGFFGTRNMGFMHQELVEILSYAMVITKNHIFTSGASGTNAAVIKGALRAEKPELLTVILPQSLKKQPPESQELLSKVKNVIEKPHNDHLPLIEASRHYFVPGRSKFAIMLLFFNLKSSEFTLKWVLANPMTTIPLVARVDNAGYVTWTSFHKCSKSSVLPFTTAGCSWKPVKKQRTSGRS